MPDEETEPEPDWEQIQAGPEFTLLRRQVRAFVFPMAALFLGWYLLYVLLAAYAHGFMSIRLWGEVTVGLVMGLLQFVSTFLITWLYVRYATRRLDPLAGRIRADAELH
jgi:uncharacterized membrane protein (DUF485 family)